MICDVLAEPKGATVLWSGRPGRFFLSADYFFSLLKSGVFFVICLEPDYSFQSLVKFYAKATENFFFHSWGQITC